MEEYDASRWTAEEMDMLAVEAGQLLDAFGLKIDEKLKAGINREKSDLPQWSGE